MDKSLRLNIGCGVDKRDGYINIDISEKVKPDKVLDIEDGLPFEDDSVKEIIAFDVLEQISTPKKFVFVMNEMWRILRKDGRVAVRVPNAAFAEAFQDPFDVRRFTVDTFTYLQGTNMHYLNMGQNYGFKPWHVTRQMCKNQVLLEYQLLPMK